MFIGYKIYRQTDREVIPLRFIKINITYLRSVTESFSDILDSSSISIMKAEKD